MPDEVEKAAEEGTGVIPFIDELHLVVAGRRHGCRLVRLHYFFISYGSDLSVANLFEPMLARGRLRCIGATSLAEYRRYIGKDAALECRRSGLGQ